MFYSNNENSKYMPSVLSSLNKLSNFNFEADAKTMFRIKEPFESYIRESIDDQKKREKLRDFLNRDIDYISEFNDIDRLQEILNKVQSDNNNFSILSKKECKILLRYDIFWIEEKYQHYKNLYIEYLKTLEIKAIKKLYKYLLALYFRKHLTFKNDSKFTDFFKFIHKKYTQNCSNIPYYLYSIFNSCNLLNNDFAKELANACIKKRQNEKINILDIIKDSYRYVKPHTDIYDEILNYIGIICKENISNEFYFRLLFDEILCSEMKAEQSARIVHNIILIFGENKYVTKESLEKVKCALLKNRHYGDPRINTLNHWNNVSNIDLKNRTNALQIFKSWLAQADLEFFFALMFENKPDEHHRKEFWQKYIKSRQLIGSKVILGTDIANSQKAREEERKNGGIKFPRFGADNTSCFILEFQSLYVVEFSDEGNAVYLYRKDEAPRQVTKNKTYYDGSGENLKDTSISIQFSKKYYNEHYRQVPNQSMRIFHGRDYTLWQSLADKALMYYGIEQGN